MPWTCWLIGVWAHYNKSYIQYTHCLSWFIKPRLQWTECAVNFYRGINYLSEGAISSYRTHKRLPRHLYLTTTEIEIWVLLLTVLSLDYEDVYFLYCCLCNIYLYRYSKLLLACSNRICVQVVKRGTFLYNMIHKN